MNNQSLQIIGKALGHKSTQATQIYARLTYDPMRAAVEPAQTQMRMAAVLVERKDNLLRFPTEGEQVSGQEPEITTTKP